MYVQNADVGPGLTMPEHSYATGASLGRHRDWKIIWRGLNRQEIEGFFAYIVHVCVHVCVHHA